MRTSQKKHPRPISTEAARPATYFYRVLGDPRPISTGLQGCPLWISHDLRPISTEYWRTRDLFLPVLVWRKNNPRPISTCFGAHARPISTDGAGAPATYFYRVVLLEPAGIAAGCMPELWVGNYPFLGRDPRPISTESRG